VIALVLAGATAAVSWYSWSRVAAAVMGDDEPSPPWWGWLLLPLVLAVTVVSVVVGGAYALRLSGIFAPRSPVSRALDSIISMQTTTLRALTSTIGGLL